MKYWTIWGCKMLPQTRQIRLAPTHLLGAQSAKLCVHVALAGVLLCKVVNYRTMQLVKFCATCTMRYNRVHATISTKFTGEQTSHTSFSFPGNGSLYFPLGERPSPGQTGDGPPSSSTVVDIISGSLWACAVILCAWNLGVRGGTAYVYSESSPRASAYWIRSARLVRLSFSMIRAR